MASEHCQLPSNTRCTTYLTRGQTVGLVITSEMGLVSISAVLLLFYIITKNLVKRTKTQNMPKEDRSFFKSPFDVYMLSLFISDLIQAIGYVFSIRWVVRGTVQCGSYCTTQGVLQQLGETTVALATLCIAVYTFLIIAFRKTFEGTLHAFIIIGVIWLYVIICIIVGLAMHNRAGDEFDTPTPYWCWIGATYTEERIIGEYFWFWFTALASVILYVLVYFRLRGNIEVEEQRWWKIRFRRRPKASGNSHSSVEEIPQDAKEASRTATYMLLYPICYVGLILPLSIVRWTGFVLDKQNPQDPNDIHSNIPDVATFFVQAFFGLSGLVNVVLVLRTRAGLSLLSETEPTPSPAHIFNSSEDVVGNPIGSEGLRLRPLRPVLNIQDELECGGHNSE